MEQTTPARPDRSGVCRERVQVLVGTGDLKQSCFMAKAGVDYLSKQEVVVFEPGQTKALFEVELLQRKVKWSTTCFFVVTLKCVPTNNALLGGPGLAFAGVCLSVCLTD